MVVEKRDGRVVQFDSNKIKAAILKAMQQQKVSDDDLITKIINSISSIDSAVLSVETIQDIVEKKLMASAHKDVAKAYILYRNERTKERNKRSSLYRRAAKILTGQLKERANANVSDESFSARREHVSEILQKQYTTDNLLTANVKKYFEDGKIYLHDFSYYATGMHNCLFVDLDTLLAQGFKLRNGDIRPANSLNSALQLTAVIFQLQSQCQFGGVGAAHLDYSLAPFVKKSLAKHLTTGLQYLYETEHEITVPSEVSMSDSYYMDNYPKAWKFAIDQLQKEAKQGFEAFYHNLNSLESRSGSQLPFSSINFGRDTSPEGQLISKSILEASINGIGRYHHTSIFPISIFQHKKGINDVPGTPNYFLKKLALQSMAKRIYPNWVNCDFTNHEETIDDPDTYMATMGCVDGESNITYQFNGTTYRETFTMMWQRVYKLVELEENEYGYYFRFQEGQCKILDTFNGFVECKLLLQRKPEHNDWLTIRVGNTHLLCTTDHPLPVMNRGRVMAKDIVPGDWLFDSEKNPIRVVEIIPQFSYIAESYDVTTSSDYFEVNGIYSHNCRTMIGRDRHGKGYSKTGRGNIVPTTIILPALGIECTGNPELFMKELDKTIEVTIQSLLQRYDIITSQKPESAFFMYKNGSIANGSDCIDTVEQAMKHGTLAIGYLGLAEAMTALFGKNHTDETIGKFALEVVKRIYDAAKGASDKYDRNFGCYATPAENLSYTAMRQLKEKYGVIKGVTDRDYLTNSHHVPVWENVSIQQKIDIEAPFAYYATSGCITYNELTSGLIQNLDAVEKIINYAMDHNIPYYALNFPIDTCRECHFSGDIPEACPQCGETNIERLRRVTGYLTCDYTNFNLGKQAEVKDRVKHNAE